MKSSMNGITLNPCHLYFLYNIVVFDKMLLFFSSLIFILLIMLFYFVPKLLTTHLTTEINYTTTIIYRRDIIGIFKVRKNLCKTKYESFFFCFLYIRSLWLGGEIFITYSYILSISF